MDESRPSVFRLLLIGLVFHLVYIGTVFDCYFTSPVVHGMQSYGLESAPAKRLVFIVGTWKKHCILGSQYSLIHNR